MSALLAAFVLAVTQDSSVLSRGAEIPGLSGVYQGVEDTTLDPQSDGPLGGSAFLSAGTGRAILIRFGDLARVVGPSRTILSARIELTLAAGVRATLVSAGEMLQPWSEGPSQVVTFGRPPALSTTVWAATHRHRRTGPKPTEWQQPGALGTSDSRPIKSARFESVGDNRFALTGIETPLSDALNRPSANYGLVLRFSEPVEFYSSESRIGKPRLVLQYGPRADPGGTLAVISIRREGLPPVPKLTEPTTKVQDGLEIDTYSRSTGPAWPNLGSPIRFVATIKNFGTSPARASGEWAINERWGNAFQLGKSLAPGEAAEVAVAVPFERSAGDARLHPVSIRLDNAGGMAQPEMTAYMGAFELRINVAQALEKKWRELAKWSGKPIEASLAQSIQHLNEVVLSRSRFASIPNGCTARVNLASIRVVADPEWPKDVPKRLHADPGFDCDVWLGYETKVDSADFEANLVKEVLKSLGLIDLGASPSQFVFERVGQKPGVPLSPYAGILGGDTRYEGMIPSGIVLPFEPSANPILDAALPEPHGQLSLGQAAFLMAKMETRDRANTDAWARPPMLTMARCVDFSGQILKDVEVKAFAKVPGGWSAAPIFSAKTSANGNFRIPDRAAEPYKANPFGVIDPDGKNGAILFEIEQYGSKAYSWVTLETVLDAGLRNPGQMALIDLRFDTTDGILQASNLAAGKLTTDSSGLLPAKLLATTDEKLDDIVAIAADATAWLEIDLGRDRAVGELRVYGNEFWNEFDILVYGTGQTVNEAIRWSGERDFKWMWRNRSKPEDGGIRYVPYRAAGRLARYIRFVNRKPQSDAKVREIKAFSVVRPS